MKHFVVCLILVFVLTTKKLTLLLCCVFFVYVGFVCLLAGLRFLFFVLLFVCCFATPIVIICSCFLTGVVFDSWIDVLFSCLMLCVENCCVLYLFDDVGLFAYRLKRYSSWSKASQAVERREMSHSLSRCGRRVRIDSAVCVIGIETEVACFKFIHFISFHHVVRHSTRKGTAVPLNHQGGSEEHQ